MDYIYMVMSKNVQRRKAHKKFFHNIFSPQAKKHRQFSDNLQWVLRHSICSPGFCLHRFRVEPTSRPSYITCGGQSNMKMWRPLFKTPWMLCESRPLNPSKHKAVCKPPQGPRAQEASTAHTWEASRGIQWNSKSAHRGVPHAHDKSFSPIPETQRGLPTVLGSRESPPQSPAPGFTLDLSISQVQTALERSLSSREYWSHNTEEDAWAVT